MSIADKMHPTQSSIPPEIRAKLAERRLADLLRFYRDLRQLYLEATGVNYIPAEFIEKPKITPEDQAFLSDLGIAPIE